MRRPSSACDGMDGILAIEGFDTSLAEGLMLLTPFNADATDETHCQLRHQVPGAATARSPTSSPLTPMTASTPCYEACREGRRHRRHERTRTSATP